MAANNITLKDIAQATGYSLISIHRAIHNKDGLSEETRTKILEAVKAMGYEVNFAASALKRNPIRVAYIGEAARSAGEYHACMLEGVHTAFDEFAGLNCSCDDLVVPYGHGAAAAECKVLDKLYDDPHPYDGIVVLPANTGSDLEYRLGKLIAKGIPVVLVDERIPQLDSLCCISPRSDLIGRLGAEYLCKVCDPGLIIIAMGDTTSKTHQENVRGFSSYIEENRLPFTTLVVDDPYDEPLLEQRLEQALLAHPETVAFYSVREKNCQAITRVALRHPERKTEVLVTELCPENVSNLERGLVSGIIDKNPFQRGYLGMHLLFEYLLKKEMPKAKVLSVPVSIVLRSNLPFYVGRMGPGIYVSSSV